MRFRIKNTDHAAPRASERRNRIRLIRFALARTSPPPPPPPPPSLSLSLRGRRWVLRAHALKLPEGYDGNIFLTGMGLASLTAFPARAAPELIAAIDRLHNHRAVRRRAFVRGARGLAQYFRKIPPIPAGQPAGGQSRQIALPGYADVCSA